MGSGERLGLNLSENLQDILQLNKVKEENASIDYEVGYGDVNYWNVNENDPNGYQLNAELEKISLRINRESQDGGELFSTRHHNEINTHFRTALGATGSPRFSKQTSHGTSSRQITIPKRGMTFERLNPEFEEDE